ncbi:MAG: hypothetical protein AAF202_12085, partial [Pseudomonadota bacterium]
GGSLFAYEKTETQCGEPDCTAIRREVTCQNNGQWDAPSSATASHYCSNRCRCPDPLNATAQYSPGSGPYRYTQATAVAANGEYCYQFRVRRVCESLTGQLNNPQAVHENCVQQ